MKHLNKIASAFCAAALGMLALTSCEGGDLYKVNAPDWVAAKVAAEDVEVLSTLQKRYEVVEHSVVNHVLTGAG